MEFLNIRTLCSLAITWHPPKVRKKSFCSTFSTDQNLMWAYYQKIQYSFILQVFSCSVSVPSSIYFMKLLLGEKFAELYATFNIREWVSHGIMYEPGLLNRNWSAGITWLYTITACYQASWNRNRKWISISWLCLRQFWLNSKAKAVSPWVGHLLYPPLPLSRYI